MRRTSLLRQIAANTARGLYYEDDIPVPLVSRELPVRLIAFYLPQFHTIPENDLWWGKGFTEWTNVTKALPRFQGHYQPHLPGALGFYDLKSTDALRAQADLARRYGIHGFCFHYYWFGGNRLLDTPLNNLLADPDIDLPFCINWANENWSRRWDGLDHQILIAQQHTPEDDIAFADAMLPLFDDRRYIRVDGRPLLMLYRPGALPDAQATVLRWRAHFRKAGEDPCIVMAQAFGDNDPRPHGMDAAVGFPPHNAGWDGPYVSHETLALLDPDYRGTVVQYDDMARRALNNAPRAFRLFPGVCPGWDNEARRPGRGFCFIGSTPEKYGTWLAAACIHAHAAAGHPDERIVFLNAWNEWAEGAHLEPDAHFGHAYLCETARVLNRMAHEPIRSPPSAAAGIPQAAAHAPGRVKAGLRRLARRLARPGADAAEALADMLRF